MKTLFNASHFEELKRQILENANCEHVIAGACKKIADAIQNKTRERVSETTLKRIFGFAEARFKPSTFTLDVLAKYCGYKHWEDYSTQAYRLSQMNHSVNPCVEELRKRIHQVTTYTLQTLQDRSGIPFRQTIPRTFLDQHLDHFLRSEATGTVLYSPAGYGKTIAVCHWVTAFLNKWQQHHTEGPLLFFISFNTLSNAYFSGRDIHDWLLCLMGYSRDDEFAQLMATLKRNDQKFYLVIDGLDNTIVKGDTFRLILSQIADVFAMYHQQPSFKMILTMRTDILMMHKDLLMGPDQGWFMGLANNAHTNVPLLDTAALKQIAENINPHVRHQITTEQARQLQHPLYLQYYYRLHRDNFSFTKIDRTTVFDQVTHFVQAKVCHGDISRKQMIISALCDNLIYKQQRFYTPKDDIIDLIWKHKAVYQELLSNGYIIEVNSCAYMEHQVQVEFANDDFLSYSVAHRLLAKNDNIVNSHLILSINSLVPACALRLTIIKWFIVYSIQTEQYFTADILNAAELCVTEKADLIMFLGCLFKKHSQGVSDRACIQRLFAAHSQAELVAYFIGKQFFGLEYQNTLQTLLLFDLNVQSRIYTHTALAMNAVILLDLAELERQIALLKHITEDDYVSFPFDPCICLDTLYYYLKFGIVKREAFTMPTKLCFNRQENTGNDVNEKHQLFYLLDIYTLIVYENPARQLSVIEAYTPFVTIQNGNNTAYKFFADVARADILLQIDPEQGMVLYNELSNAQQVSYNEYSPLMRAYFSVLKFKVMILQKDEENIPAQMQLVLTHADQYGFKLIKARCLALFLKYQSNLNLHQDPDKTFYHDFLRLTQEHDLNGSNFIERVSLIS